MKKIQKILRLKMTKKNSLQERLNTLKPIYDPDPLRIKIEKKSPKLREIVF